MKPSFFTAVTALSICSAALFFSCSKTKEPVGPVTPPVTGGGGDTITKQRNVVAWVDCRANVFTSFGRMNDTNKIKLVLDTLKMVGVNGLVIDVKGSSGYTMYASAYTKQSITQDGYTVTPGVDYVGYMIQEARKRSFKIYASIITFVEGDNSRGAGTIFDDAAFRTKYESVVCDVNGNRVPVTSTGRNGFVNPAQPEVQTRALNIIKELVQKYDIDGLVLDYCRYTDIDADFSDYSKSKFIEFLKTRYNDNDAANMNFPGDVVASWKKNGDQTVPNATGKYFNKWLFYRASVIHDFVVKARAAVKSVKPAVTFGVYVGAWYTTYYQVGVNWASNAYDPFNDQAVRFDWAYPNYGETGYAEQLDHLMTGNYFTQLMLADNPATASLQYHWWSVEGSINGTQYITKNKVPLYGSIDMGNVDWASQADISKTIKYILSRTSGGVMLFDVVHAYAPQTNRLKQPLWNAIRDGVQK